MSQRSASVVVAKVRSAGRSTPSGPAENTTRGIVALVFRCKPSGGTERTSGESTAVSWLTRAEVSDRMPEVYAIRLLDALDGNGPYVRSHDGKHLIPAG